MGDTMPKTLRLILGLIGVIQLGNGITFIAVSVTYRSIAQSYSYNGNTVMANLNNSLSQTNLTTGILLTIVGLAFIGTAIFLSEENS